MARGWRRYGYDFIGFGQAVVRYRTKLGWSRRRLAREIGVNPGNMKRVEEQGESLKEGKRERLVDVLIAGLKRLEGTGFDEALTRRELGELAGLSATTSTSARRAPSKPSLAAKQSRLIDVVPLLLDMRRAQVQIARDDAETTLRAVEDDVRRTDDDAIRIAIMAHIIAGVSFGEAAAIPPWEGRHHLQQAIELAEMIGDPALIAESTWRLIEQDRKEADFSEDPRRQAELYAGGLARLDAVIGNEKTPPALKICAYSERIKIRLGDGSPGELIKDEVQAGMRLAEEVEGAVKMGLRPDGLWAPVLAEHAQVHIRTARLRAEVRFGIKDDKDDKDDEVVTCALTEMRRFPLGLTVNIELATTVLTRAQLGLSRRDEDARGAGLTDWLDAYEFSQSVGFEKQVAAAKRIIRDPDVRPRLPRQFDRWCRRCRGPRPWKKLFDRGTLFYLCLGCRSETIYIP